MGHIPGPELINRLQQAKTDGSPLQPAVTLTYTYDKNGNRDLLTDNLGGSVDYTFDNLNRLDTIMNFGLTFDFDYDALSRRKKTTLPNGTVTDYAYDVASQLTSLTHSLAAVPFTQFDYTQYDGVGNKEVVSVQRTGVSVQSPLNYVYDDLYRLDTATKVVPTGTNEDYGYDPVGNRLTKTGQITPSVFDAANRLLDDQTYTYIYDDNGNLTSKTNLTTSQVTSYSYDAENQLISVQSPVASAQYKYDGLGRRIEKAINSSPFTRYIYDNEDILLEYNGSNVLQARYTHGAGIDEPLMMERDLNANAIFEPTERFFYHTDGLGSITDLTNSTGTIAQSYVYDSFGQIITVTSGLENPYTYTGRELDNESGLYFYRRRYYDPMVGRFLQEDPIGFLGGVNKYAYTLNNPINFTDPSGLITEEQCEAIFQAEVIRCEETTSTDMQLQICLTEALIALDNCKENAKEPPEPGEGLNNNFCQMIFPRKSGHFEELVLA